MALIMRLESTVCLKVRVKAVFEASQGRFKRSIINVGAPINPSVKLNQLPS